MTAGESRLGARISLLTPHSSLFSSPLPPFSPEAAFDGLGVKVIRFGAYGGFFYKASRTGG